MEKTGRVTGTSLFFVFVTCGEVESSVQRRLIDWPACLGQLEYVDLRRSSDLDMAAGRGSGGTKS